MYSNTSGAADKNSESRPTRNKQRSIRLDHSIITDTIGERSNDAKIEIRSAYSEVLDVFSSEMEKRFLDNSDILLAISEAGEFDHEKLKPLEKLGLTLPPIEELSVAKSYIGRKKFEHEIQMKDKGHESFKVVTYLAFESKRLKDVSTDVILKVFNDNPNRRIQLY